MTDDLIMVVDICYLDLQREPNSIDYRAMMRRKSDGPVNLNGFRVVRSYELGKFEHGTWGLANNLGILCDRLESGEMSEEDLPDSLYN